MMTRARDRAQGKSRHRVDDDDDGGGGDDADDDVEGPEMVMM